MNDLGTSRLICAETVPLSTARFEADTVPNDPQAESAYDPRSSAWPPDFCQKWLEEEEQSHRAWVEGEAMKLGLLPSQGEAA